MIYTAIIVTLLLIVSAADTVIAVMATEKLRERRREARTDARVEAAGAAEKETDAERKMDEGFQNIMTYGGSFTEFMARKDE